MLASDCNGIALFASPFSGERLPTPRKPRRKPEPQVVEPPEKPRRKPQPSGPTLFGDANDPPF